ncbi:MAG: thymidine kinase [Planctomycetota bacterium]
MPDPSSMSTADDLTTKPLAHLTVVCGPMFAGKTTKVIELLNRHRALNRSIQVAKPHIDTRYHPTDIATHDGHTYPAVAITSPEELLELTDAQVVALDEAHFYRDGLLDAVRAMLDRGQILILAGLDRTSLNEPFAEMAGLLIEADEVIKLAGVCAICGRPAIHTIRLFDSTEDIVVGGEGMFENRCREHLER